VIGLVTLFFGVWFLLGIAALHDVARDLRTTDFSGLKTFQSEMTALQHLINIKSALEKNIQHQSFSSKGSAEKM